MITTNWKDEPDFRGTFSILSSCLITLSLCLWTTVHLDIPEHNRTTFQLFRRLKWVVIGLIAPECLTFVAWTQRREALKLHAEATELFERIAATRMKDFDNGTKNKLPRQHPWTLVHSYYASMGGFAFDTSAPTSLAFLPDSRTRAALTPKGFLFLLKQDPDLIPDVSLSEISDRSKASSLAKLLVLIQTVWFCVQCFGRISQRLHITLLEVTTLAHACCALVTYSLWWNKPVDIDEPTLIRGSHARAICAYMWSASGASQSKEKDVGREAEMESMSCSGIVPLNVDPLTYAEDPRTSTLYEQNASPGTFTEFKTGDVIVLRPYETLPRTLLGINRDSSRFVQTERVNNESGTVEETVTQLPAVVRLTQVDAERWALIALALQRYGFKFPTPSNSGTLDLDLVRPRTTMPWLFPETVDWENDFISLFGFGFFAALYGGVHTIAWNSPFPTQDDMIWWRGSVILVMTYAFVVELFVAFVNAMDDASKNSRGYQFYSYSSTGFQKQGKTNAVSKYLEHLIHMSSALPRPLLKLLRATSFILLITISCIISFGFFGYFVARGYLIYESFKELLSSELPEDAFHVPSWSPYFPHIS